MLRVRSQARTWLPTAAGREDPAGSSPATPTPHLFRAWLLGEDARQVLQDPPLHVRGVLPLPEIEIIWVPSIGERTPSGGAGAWLDPVAAPGRPVVDQVRPLTLAGGKPHLDHGELVVTPL